MINGVNKILFLLLITIYYYLLLNKTVYSILMAVHSDTMAYYITAHKENTLKKVFPLADNRWRFYFHILDSQYIYKNFIIYTKVSGSLIMFEDN